MNLLRGFLWLLLAAAGAEKASADYILNHAYTYVDAATAFSQSAPFAVDSVATSPYGVTAQAISVGNQPDPLSVAVTATPGNSLGGGQAIAEWFDRISLIPTRAGLPTPDSVRANFSAAGTIGGTTPSVTFQGAAGFVDKFGGIDGLLFDVTGGKVGVTTVNGYVDSYQVTPAWWFVNYHYDAPLSSDGGYYFGFALGVAVGGLRPTTEGNGWFARDPIRFTLADGNTPEEDGYRVVLDSGMQSPDLAAIPEPASIILLGIGGVALVASRWGKGRKVVSSCAKCWQRNP